jgi:hypothetical protein
MATQRLNAHAVPDLIAEDTLGAWINETKFLHTDFTPGRRIPVCQRGDDNDPLIVAANFSHFQTEHPLTFLRIFCT